MRSFEWRENQDEDDTGFLPTNEPTRAANLMDSGRNRVRVAKSLDFELDLRRSRQSLQGACNPQSNVGRASSLRERTRSVDETRRLDPPTPTDPQESSGSLLSA